MRWIGAEKLRPDRWVLARRLEATSSVATTAPTAVLRLVDADVAPAEVASVERADRIVRIARTLHLHEREAARATRLAVGDDVHRLDGPVAPEEGLEVLLGAGEGSQPFRNQVTMLRSKYSLPVILLASGTFATAQELEAPEAIPFPMESVTVTQPGVLEFQLDLPLLEVLTTLEEVMLLGTAGDDP